MERSHSDTVAHLLGLTKDGLPATPKTAETLEGARKRKETIGNPLGQVEDEEFFSDEFASQYLPSLVCSFLALGSYPSDASDQISQHTYLSYSDVVGQVAMNSTCSLPRFVRQVPDEASALFLNLSTTVMEVLDQVVLTRNVPNSSAAVASILVPLMILYTTLVNQLPLASRFPSLPLQSRQTLHTLRARLLNHELPELAEAILSCARIATDTVCTILLRMSREETESSRASEERITSVWWSCEHRLAADREDEPQRSNCVQLQNGEEMMACSRCIAVRYCSKEHQKADWKRHKRFCFKPSW